MFSYIYLYIRFFCCSRCVLLRAKGIEPVITLHHSTEPIYIYKYIYIYAYVIYIYIFIHTLLLLF